MSERIELIKAFHECRSFGTAENRQKAERDVVSAYRSLTPEECRTLAQLAVGQRIETILSHLACLQAGSLAGSHLELAKIGVLYPPVVFHRADDEAASLLIRQLEDGTAENINLCLLALAWADSFPVLQAFQRWKAAPPNWVASLYLPPHGYADSAGWELTDTGVRRGLTLGDCYPLVPPDHPDAVVGPVRVNVPSELSCGFCGRRMTALIVFDLTHEMLAFMEIPGTRLRLETCDVCTCYGTVFSQVDCSGGASWHPANERPAYLPDDAHDWEHPKENALLISRHGRSCMESADRNMPISFSQIGGHPSWEQDAEYPRCPCCQQKMVFIAQLSNHDYDRYAEGIYYAFLCRACLVAATNYQQT
jgi:hypothetical protein